MIWVYVTHGLIHCYALLYPALLLAIRSEFDLTWFNAGLIGTAGALLYAAGALPAGWLTDRLGPGKVLPFSVGVGAAGCCLCALAPSAPVLAVGVILIGLAGSSYHPAALTLMTSVLTGRGRILALQGIGGNLGMAAAPALAASLSVLWTWRGVYGATAVIGLVMTAVLLRTSRRLATQVVHAEAQSKDVVVVSPAGEWEPQPPARSSAPPPRDPGRRQWVRLALVYVVMVTTGFVFNGYMTYLPAYLGESVGTRLPALTTGGLLSSLVLLAGAAGEWIGGIAADRTRNMARTFAVILLASAAALAGMGLTAGILLVALAMLNSIGFFACDPLASLLLADNTPSRRRGIAFGVSLALSAGIGSLAGGAMGLVADTGGLGLVFVTLAGICLPAMACLVALAGRAGRGSGGPPRARE